MEPQRDAEGGEMLDSPSGLPRPTRETAKELKSLLSGETAMTKLRRLATAKPVAFNPVCHYTTPTACRFYKREDCTDTHYEPIVRPWTDATLGYCSYLNLCYGDPMFRNNPSLGGGSAPRGSTKECRYTHFQVVPALPSKPEERTPAPPIPPALKEVLLERNEPALAGTDKGNLPQWIDCDLRQFDYSILGQFQVIVADPPWDIHMALPYGTMTDDEMRRLPIPSLQPDWGILALWVTGRAMELGRELLSLWGYQRVDELVWVKDGPLAKVCEITPPDPIVLMARCYMERHTCEHLLLALKLPASHPRSEEIPWDSHPTLRALRKGIDTDVVVAEVRETSRKPDEVYGVIERLVPHGRKLELFGRKHNIRPGWLTLGNQLGESQLTEKDLYDRLQERYPAQSFNLV